MRGDPSPLWSLSTRRRDAAGTTALSGYLLVLLACAVLVAGCASGRDSGPAPAAPPEGPNAREQQVAADALAAYEGFWRVSNLAYAKPGAKDWRPELSVYASGQPLDAVLGDVENYASFPAHKEGQPARAPTVESVILDQPARAIIMDCLDVRDVPLVSDRTGADLRDTANQPPRYRYRAEAVLQSGSNRWLVEITKPLLDQPC